MRPPGCTDDCASARGHVLAYAPVLARDLASARDALARVTVADDLAHNLGRNLDAVLALARDLDRARAPDLALYGDLARNLARDLDRARDLAHDLALDLDRARDLARDLARALVEGDLARVLAAARVLDAARSTARDLAHDLDRVGFRADAAARWRRPVRVTPPAWRLAAAAGWLLPVAARARYREEYHCELWDLAATGAGRGQQIGCAVRQLRCAVPLRFAVLAPRRRKAPL